MKKYFEFFNAKGIAGAINVGVGACAIFPLIACAFMIFMSQTKSSIITNIITILWWSGLGFGIYKHSRICAGLALFSYIANELYMICEWGYTRTNILWFFFILSFSYVLTATRILHRKKKEEGDIQNKLGKDAIVHFLVIFILFIAGIFLAIRAHEKVVQHAWLKYVLRVEEQKKMLGLPERITDNVTLRDVYFEDKTMVFEYDVQNLKNLSNTEWYTKTNANFNISYCQQVKFFNSHVLYRFTQGYDKREFDYDARDCH